MLITRRDLTAGAAFTIVPRHVLGAWAGQAAPSDRVNIACIGMGRQGMLVTMALLAEPAVQIVAVCDCNKGSKDYAEYADNSLLQSARELLGKGYEQWGEDLASPGRVVLTPSFGTSLGMGGREPAKRLVEAYYGSRQRGGTYRGCAAYSDFRELLEKESGIDAVYIATPDHWHAPIAMAAMRKRKHVLGQKPMAHSIGEARRLAATARDSKVATAVAVNNPTSSTTQLIKNWIQDGAIGHVREVHNWSNRPFWPQGIGRPETRMTPPEGLDWNMWLGPAPERPFHKVYQPFVWRGWMDFGCGSFGDMGCYSFAGIFQILGLTPPTSVEASTSESWEETYPKASIVHMDFPEREGRGPIHLVWYDGGLMPRRPAGISDDVYPGFRRGGEGILYVGDKGILLADFNGYFPRVFPASPKYVTPTDYSSERDHVIENWLAACKGAPAGPAAFPAQAPVTEALLLGCLAQRLPNQKLEWDTALMKVTNQDAANRWIDPPYRGEWV